MTFWHSDGSKDLGTRSRPRTPITALASRRGRVGLPFDRRGHSLSLASPARNNAIQRTQNPAVSSVIRRDKNPDNVSAAAGWQLRWLINDQRSVQYITLDCTKLIFTHQRFGGSTDRHTASSRNHFNLIHCRRRRIYMSCNKTIATTTSRYTDRLPGRV